MIEIVRELSESAADFIRKLNEMRITMYGMQKRIADLEAQVSKPDSADPVLADVEAKSADVVVHRSLPRTVSRIRDEAKALGRKIIGATDEVLGAASAHDAAPQTGFDDFGSFGDAFASAGGEQVEDIVTTPAEKSPPKNKRKAADEEASLDDRPPHAVRRTSRKPKAVVPFKPSRPLRASSINVEEPASPSAGESDGFTPAPPRSKRKYTSRVTSRQSLAKRKAIADAAFSGSFDLNDTANVPRACTGAGGSASEDSGSESVSFLVNDVSSQTRADADETSFEPSSTEEVASNELATASATRPEDANDSSDECNENVYRPVDAADIENNEYTKKNNLAVTANSIRQPKQRLDTYNIIRVFMAWREEQGFLDYFNSVVRTIIGEVRGRPESTERAIALLTSPEFRELEWTKCQNFQHEPCLLCGNPTFNEGTQLTRESGHVEGWIGPHCTHRARLLLLAYDFLAKLRQRTIFRNFHKESGEALDEEAHFLDDEFQLIVEAAKNRMEDTERV